MSGIGGIVGCDKKGRNALAAAQICDGMLTALKGRGADVHGTYISEDVCLIHTCHSDEGKQPLRAAVGNKAFVLVFDGELYNKEEILKELLAKGSRFPETSDATIVLHAYATWGQSCVERMNGVFAFALWDGSQLFLARDRLGLRPLFYSMGTYGMVFASSIKTILAHPNIHPVINADGAAEIILLGPGRTPGSGIFKQISEINPGEHATYIPGHGVTKTAYWRLKAKTHRENFKDTTAVIRELLSDSVKRQFPGATKRASILLSGGLDSSAIAALAKAKESFSVDYIGNDKYFAPTDFQPEDDGAYIKRVVSHLGLRHKQIILGSDELADALSDAMDARGLPGMADIDSSLLLFLRRVREETPIAISGEGADEILGGYRWYQDEELLKQNSFPWSQSAENRAKFLLPELLEKIQSPKEYAYARYERTIKEAETLYDDEPIEGKIRQMYMLNLKWFLQCLAARNDTMAAAAGMSVRAPFLDYRLVEYLYNVPWSFKNHENREKGILREALKGILPDAVLFRKKSPFPKTHNPGYLARVRDMLKAVLNDDSSPIFSLVPKEMLKALADGESSTNWYGQLMAHPQTIAYFLQINMWMKNYAVTIEN
ncbi:MAG: asparagine synthase (glutamine-hydrolyzing) [Defluviitaleaceae bacterium]|nr:asparagine synthase (glutamine-hydrolyzing) [Defluviitaleaceae bacterium]